MRRDAVPCVSRQGHFFHVPVNPGSSSPSPVLGCGNVFLWLLTYVPIFFIACRVTRDPVCLFEINSNVLKTILFFQIDAKNLSSVG